MDRLNRTHRTAGGEQKRKTFVIDFVNKPEDIRTAFEPYFTNATLETETDPYVDDDELSLLEAELHLDELDVTFHRYPGTHHWFFEEDRDAYDEVAAGVEWERTLTFLHDRLRTGWGSLELLSALRPQLARSPSAAPNVGPTTC